MKKHQAVLAEINNHENRIAAVCQSGQQMLDDGHFASDEIRSRAGTLNDHWTQLKEKAFQVHKALLYLFNTIKTHKCILNSVCQKHYWRLEIFFLPPIPV